MEQRQMTEKTGGVPAPDEQEIDLVEIIRKFWKNKKLIIRTTIVFIVLGILVALLSATEYTAGCTMVPQTDSKKVGGNLGGLAAMAGINLGDMTGGEVLSPKVYSKIMGSVPFQKEIMRTPLKFEKIETPVTLLDYYTKKEYRPFNPIGVLKKYTIGLPGLIMKAVRGNKSELPETEDSESLQSYTREEYACSKIIRSIVSLDLNSKDGYLQLNARMADPYAAAQLAEKVQQLLQRYITEFKIEKVKSNLDFIQSRYDEAKQEFEQIQAERAMFRDANKNMVSARALTEQEKLDTRYNLALGIYSELSKQLEQAKIQVKETTPILTVIDPVSVPLERTKPRRAMICATFAFLGFFVGCALVLGLPFLADLTENEKIRKWVVG